jgi:hypothetical protein
MNNDIERLFKKSLENYSVPYEPGAWSALSERMDAAAPSTPFYRKWWFAASAVVAVAGASALLFVGGNAPESKSPVAVAENSSASQAENGAAEQNDVSVAFSQEVTESQYSAASTHHSSGVQSGGQGLGASDPSPVIASPALPSATAVTPAPPKPDQKTKTYLPLNLPASVCLNEQLEIYNPNKEDLLLIVHPNGKTTGVKPLTKSGFAAAVPGTYKVISGDHTDLIRVNGPESDISIVQTSVNPFENGIPYMTFEIAGEGKNPVWSTNVSSSDSGASGFTVHPFREHAVDVSVIMTDANGCRVQARRKFDFPSDYNLLAPNAINLSSTRDVNRTFMPEALRIRDAAFEMLILDAKTQQAVYRTTDVSQPWDGTDELRGETAQAGSTWIWKVVLKNPMPGEPRVYSGTIKVVE